MQNSEGIEGLKLLAILSTCTLLVGSSCNDSDAPETQPNSSIQISLEGDSVQLKCGFSGYYTEIASTRGFFDIECTLRNNNQFSSNTSLLVSFAIAEDVLDDGENENATNFVRTFTVNAEDRRTKLFTRPLPIGADNELFFLLSLFDTDTGSEIDSGRVVFPL